MKATLTVRAETGKAMPEHLSHSKRFGTAQYDHFFADAMAQIHAEQRYRVFADLERMAGDFPRALWHGPSGSQEVIIWCSNDYLGMGQHPSVIAAMTEAAKRLGTGAGGTRNISGTTHPLLELEIELADFITRKRRWFSPQDMSQTRQASPRLRSWSPIVLSSRMRST